MKPAALLLKDVAEASAPRRLEVPREQPAPRGFEEGYREGVQHARREAEALLRTAQAKMETQYAEFERDFRARLQSLDALLAALTARQAGAAQAREEAVVTLAYEAVLRILHEAHDSRGLIARIVSQALREESPFELTIRLHAADHERLLGDAAVVALLAARPEVRCVTDDALGPLECLIDTPQGSRDVGLATQLEQLTRAWLVALGAAAESHR